MALILKKRITTASCDEKARLKPGKVTRGTKGGVEQRTQTTACCLLGKVRFKLELGHGPAITISIIQQQGKTGTSLLPSAHSAHPSPPIDAGDTTTFLDSIAQMKKALDDYEKDAAFISSANGWN
jgi:hypothetical protein